MPASQCQAFQSSFYATWKSDLFHAVLDHFGLSETQRARDLSRGQRAGLCLALTLAPEPSLLVLDDPALGLDPVARRNFLESMIYVTRSQGRTVFFSSHLMADVERVADHVAILHEGVLRVACPIETFRSRVKRFVLRFDHGPPDLPKIRGLLHHLRAADHVQLTIANADDQTQSIITALGASSVEEVAISLEDAFIDFLGDRRERGTFMA